VEWLLQTQNRSFAAFELLLSHELLVNIAAKQSLTEVLASNDVDRYEFVAPEVFWILLHPDARVRERAREIVHSYRRRRLPLDRASHVLQTLANLVCFAFTLMDDSALKVYCSLGLASDEPRIVWPMVAFMLSALEPEPFIKQYALLTPGLSSSHDSVWGNGFNQDFVECIVSQASVHPDPSLHSQTAHS
jgi:hypothetical protein